mgnify:CR=1 FL=1
MCISRSWLTSRMKERTLAAFQVAEVLFLMVAFIVSVFAIRFLMGYIRKHDFKAFGVYRIVLGILVLAYFFLLK